MRFYNYCSFLISSSIVCIGIITVVFLFATVAFLFVFPDEKQTALELIQKSCPVLILILYWLSSTQKICKAMFVNCDVSLLKYGFYRDKKGILSNFRSRLKKMIAYNLIPSIVMIVLLSIFVYFLSVKKRKVKAVYPHPVIAQQSTPTIRQVLPQWCLAISKQS